MKRITFNLNDPVAERWLADVLAQGQQQTDVITTALRQAATTQGSVSPREQALQQEIARLHRLIERIATGREAAVSAASAPLSTDPSPSESWTW